MHQNGFTDAHRLKRIVTATGAIVLPGQVDPGFFRETVGGASGVPRVLSRTAC